jgi:hypothetical protein
MALKLILSPRLLQEVVPPVLTLMEKLDLAELLVLEVGMIPQHVVYLVEEGLNSKLIL